MGTKKSIVSRARAVLAHLDKQQSRVVERAKVKQYVHTITNSILKKRKRQ